MRRVILVFCVLAAGFVMGKAKMILDSVTECMDPEINVFNIQIEQENINRTHGKFSVTFDLKEEINDDFGIILAMCIKVDDDNCELVKELIEPRFCNFIKILAEENSSLMSKYGLSSDCPIPKGRYELDDFMLDYSELQKEDRFGTYQGKAYITRNEERIGCIKIEVTIAKDDE